MPITPINVGTAPNNGTGDPLRLAFQKINANEAYLKLLIDGLGRISLVDTVPPTGEENILYVERTTLSLKAWNGTAYNNYSGTGEGGGAVSYQVIVDALGYVPSSPADLTALENDLALQIDQGDEDTLQAALDADAALSENVVHKTGNETIAGEKTFTSPIIPDGIFLKHNYFPINRNGHTGISSDQNYINIDSKAEDGTNNRTMQIIFPSPVGSRREYTLPDKSGTVALLSDTENGEKKRTTKVITNTTQYTLVTADFTDFNLQFSANGGETISVILNSGVAPTVGAVQMISSGNNFLQLSLGTGVTVIKPENTTFKTRGKGEWLGLMKLESSNTFSLNGGLESTGETGQTYTVFSATENGLVPTPNEVGNTKFLRQDGAWVVPQGGQTYGVFTNTQNGLVPAPNVSGSSTYGITIDSPTEGQEFTEGDTITVTGTVTETSGTGVKKVLKSTGWEDESGGTTNITQIVNRSYNDLQDLPELFKGRVIKQITDSEYTIIESDKDKFLIFISFGLPQNVKIPDNTFTSDVELVGRSAAGQINFISPSGHCSVLPPNKNIASISQEGFFFIKYSSAGSGEALITGDLIETYSVRQSPNGTLYKVSVDDSGNQVITPL